MRNKNYCINEIRRLASKLTEQNEIIFLQIVVFMLWRSGKKSDSEYFTPGNILAGAIEYYQFRARQAVRITAAYLASGLQ